MEKEFSFELIDIIDNQLKAKIYIKNKSFNYMFYQIDNLTINEQRKIYELTINAYIKKIERIDITKYKKKSKIISEKLNSFDNYNDDENVYGSIATYEEAEWIVHNIILKINKRDFDNIITVNNLIKYSMSFEVTNEIIEEILKRIVFNLAVIYNLLK